MWEWFSWDKGNIKKEKVNPRLCSETTAVFLSLMLYMSIYVIGVMLTYKGLQRYGGQASKCPGHQLNTADCLGNPCHLKVVSIINTEGHTSPLGVDGQLRG